MSSDTFKTTEKIKNTLQKKIKTKTNLKKTKKVKNK